MNFDDQRVRTFVSDYSKASGQRLQAMRKVRRLSQAQIAEIAGVTQQLVSYAETGLRIPTLAVRMKLVSALCCEHDDIWPAPDRHQFSRQAVAA